jgi:hypothetical protein
MDLESVILEKEKKRYKLLLSAYELYIETGNTWVQRRQLVQRSGLADNEAADAMNYLEAKGLLEAKTMGAADGFSEITHRGILEVEQSVKNPGKATSHFQVPVIQQVTQHFHSNVGAVQMGGNSIATVNQNAGIDLVEFLRLIQQVKEAVKTLPPAQQQEADGLIQLIEEEAKSENRNLLKIKSYARSLLPFTKEVVKEVVIEGIKRHVGLADY